MIKNYAAVINIAIRAGSPEAASASAEGCARALSAKLSSPARFLRIGRSLAGVAGEWEAEVELRYFSGDDQSAKRVALSAGTVVYDLKKAPSEILEIAEMPDAAPVDYDVFTMPSEVPGARTTYPR